MMEQDTNKEYLKKLLDFLQNRVLSNSANKWFANDLYKLLAPVSDARISDIHEQCIESILQEQAVEFYKDFTILDIRPQLITDFIKMEHWHRRNNIQEFCMALYQQIEAITNFLGEDENLNLIWRSVRNAGFLVDFNSKDIKIRWDKGKTIEKYIIYNKEKKYSERPELKDLFAMDKYKAILFLIVYYTNISMNNKSNFDEDFFLGQEIYYVRNLNHRGKLTELSDNVKRIIESPIYSMYSMLGFYVRFVSGIKKHYPINKDLVEFAEICCRQYNI